MNARRAIFAGLCAALGSLACISVPGEGKFVRLASEEAIIIWDEGAKREHFIRRASFDTDAKDFGFLVPTPSKPELGESDDEAFALLARTTAAKPASPVAPSAVTVLEHKLVAGFDAAVLEATDAQALDAWLKRNGYPSSPALVEWVAPYVAAHWKITAFKIAADSTKVVTSALRMSFQAEKPFFPYREPAVQRPAGDERLLRLYFVADGPVQGTIGETAQWVGRAVWSNEIEGGQLAELLKRAKLPSQAGGGGRWLTEFEDRSSMRAGNDDLYFSRAEQRTPIERAPVVRYGMTTYATILAVVLIGVGGLIYRRRRRNRRPLG